MDRHACGITADIPYKSDIHMPTISGVDFLTIQKRKGCKVENMALISGDWSESLRQQAKHLGCKTFEKLFRIADLTKWLEECESRINPGRKLAELAEIRRRNETAKVL